MDSPFDSQIKAKCSDSLREVFVSTFILFELPFIQNTTFICTTAISVRRLAHCAGDQLNGAMIQWTPDA